MKLQVTEQGVMIPKELLGEVTEVEILYEEGRIIIVPQLVFEAESVEIPEDNKNTEDWHNLSLEGLEKAYGDNEPEYTLDQIKEINLDYEGK